MSWLPHWPPELLTPAEMARADAAAIAGGIPGRVLMEAAGRAVARALRRHASPARTLILAGPGNNGGDGYVAARLLHAQGWPVAVAALAPPAPGSDAAHAAALWQGPTLPFTPAEAARAFYVIDAVFGAGLSRPVEGLVAATLAASGGPVLAVDVPSGLDGATGRVMGFAPAAALTVTFFRAKPGHLLFPGRALCGRLVLADIGLPAAVLGSIAPRVFRNDPALWQAPALAVVGHKYQRGHVAVLAGAAMPGAARLAAQAARRAGAGLVSIFAPDAVTAAILRGAEPGLIVRQDDLDAGLADARLNAWVVGPGLPPTTETRALLRRVIDAGRAVLVDAGALVAAGGADALRGAAVLTPHEGEFAAAFGDIADKLSAARAAARATDAVVLLKGADTVIAAPDGRAAINDTAPPSLATAGAGDVLAGLIAALLARGMAPFEAACAAAHWHGRLAAACPGALVAEDLIAAQARVALASGPPLLASS